MQPEYTVKQKKIKAIFNGREENTAFPSAVAVFIYAPVWCKMAT
jgi:hypothetical protein